MRARLIYAALRQVYRVGFWVLWARALVVHPHARGVKGLITNDGAVLFVRHTYGPREWELPGGGQHRHELPREALIRELREELGIEVSDPVELGTFHGPRQYSGNVVVYFGVELADREIRIDRVEIAEASWCDPAAPPLPLGWYAREVLRANGTTAPTM